MNLLTLHFHHVPCLEKPVFNLSNTNRASTLCSLMLDSAVSSQHILRILFGMNKFISFLINHKETFNDRFMFFKTLHKCTIHVFSEEMEDMHSSEISSSKPVWRSICKADLTLILLPAYWSCDLELLLL